MSDRSSNTVRMLVLLCGVLTILSSELLSAESWDRERSHDRSTEFSGFVQPERLYWRPFDLSGVPSAEFKLLSFDERTGARSLLVRLPAGWKQAPGHHSTDLEMFVLEGGVTMGDDAVGRYGYAFYPAGYPHEYSTEFGAVVLQFWAGEPDFHAGAESGFESRSGTVIEGWRYGDAPSIAPAEFPKFREEAVRDDSPVRIKLMRNDEASGEKTWIAVIPGGGPRMIGDGDLPPWTSNAVWEEGLLLAGEMTIGECLPQGEVAGTYTPGGYFFRPAGQRYGGPSLYSDSYSIWLFRSGGGHRVTYHETCESSAPVRGERRSN